MEEPRESISPPTSTRRGGGRRKDPYLGDSSADSRSHKAKVSYDFYFPLFALAITFLTMSVFETVQLSIVRDGIVGLKNNQNSDFNESKKMRVQFDSIAKGTMRLAKEGNVNALKIVAQLEKQGIKINLD